MDDKERHDLLANFIMESSDHPFQEAEIDVKIETLSSIYQSGFRHQYSKIFNILSILDEDGSDKITQVADNVRSIYERIRQSQSDDTLSKSIGKLYDHINLEVSRIQYTHTISQKVDEQGNQLQAKIDKIKEQAQDLQQQAQYMQREYITILGIFSSIIITVVAGLVFSSSVLNNIDKVSIYHLTFVMLFIALVLFNLINIMLEFIRSVSQLDSVKLHGSKIGIINLIMSAAMAIDILIWACK